MGGLNHFNGEVNEVANFVTVFFVELPFDLHYPVGKSIVMVSLTKLCFFHQLKYTIFLRFSPEAKTDKVVLMPIRKTSLFLILFLSFFSLSAGARTITLEGRMISGKGNQLPRIEAEFITISLGGAIIKKVRNTSSLGFVIEAPGGITLYQNHGEDARGLRLGPGDYRVFPYLEKGKRSDRVRLELELQETGEWVTEGGRHHIIKFQPQ